MPRCRHPTDPVPPVAPSSSIHLTRWGAAAAASHRPVDFPQWGAAASHPPWPRGKHGLLLRMTVVSSNHTLPLGKGVCLLKELRSTWLPSARTYLEQKTVLLLPWPVSRLYARIGRLCVPSRSCGLGLLFIRICWQRCYHCDYGPGLALKPKALGCHAKGACRRACHSSKPTTPTRSILKCARPAHKKQERASF
jgi:hypothetical protein